MDHACKTVLSFFYCIQTIMVSKGLNSLHGVGLVDSISLPLVPGSIRGVGSLAADSAVCDFTVV
jgi:hypothetical protein